MRDLNMVLDLKKAAKYYNCSNTRFAYATVISTTSITIPLSLISPARDRFVI